MVAIETPTNASDLLSQKQVAEAYPGFSERKLERLRMVGGGPRYIKIGRVVKYRLADVEAWLADHAFENTAEARRAAAR